MAGADVLPSGPERGRAAGADFLLPNYDEYLIAYKDRGAVLDAERARNLGVASNREYPHQVVLDGRVAGSWRRQMTETKALVAVKAYKTFDKGQLRALQAQASAFGRFFAHPCRLSRRECA